MRAEVPGCAVLKASFFDSRRSTADVTFQMGVSTLPHQIMLDAMEILGTVVAPIVLNDVGFRAVRA